MLTGFLSIFQITPSALSNLFSTDVGLYLRLTGISCRLRPREVSPLRVVPLLSGSDCVGGGQGGCKQRAWGGSGRDRNIPAPTVEKDRVLNVAF